MGNNLTFSPIEYFSRPDEQASYDMPTLKSSLSNTLFNLWHLEKNTCQLQETNIKDLKNDQGGYFA